MGFRADYVTNGRILTRIFHGEVTPRDVIDSWLYLIDNHRLDDCLGVITDYRDCLINSGPEAIEEIDAFLREHPEYFSRLRRAKIIDSPDVALSLLSDNALSEHDARSFSSYEAAFAWIIS